jgi:hypothetical protein
MMIECTLESLWYDVSPRGVRTQEKGQRPVRTHVFHLC